MNWIELPIVHSADDFEPSTVMIVREHICAITQNKRSKIYEVVTSGGVFDTPLGLNKLLELIGQ